MKQILQDIKTQFAVDFKTVPKILLLESVGTASALIAATCLAFMGSSVNFVFIFAAYLTGSITWLAAAVMRRNSFNIILNVGFGLLNIIGLIRAIMAL